MNCTYHQYLEHCKSDPKWYRAATEEDFNAWQENCLLAEFMGYEERPFTTLKTWDEEMESYDDVMYEYGLYMRYEPKDKVVYDRDDVLLYDSMGWCEWGNLMMLVFKIFSYPITDNAPIPNEVGWVGTEDFQLNRTGIQGRVWIYTKVGWQTLNIYNQYVEGKPEMSNCESYEGAVYKTMVDIARFIKENNQKEQ